MMNHSTTKQVPAIRGSLLVIAAGAALALTGCSAGSNSSAAGSSTVSWPPATPPATTEKNTYVGTQSPGWYTITIDHTNNTFSYQNLSTNSAAVSGNFTTTGSGGGFLALSSGGYVLETLSRAVLLVPAPTASGTIPFTDNVVFAVDAPSCQTIPSRTKFAYIAAPNPYYGNIGVEEALVDSGMLDASTDASGANWTFGGELQYVSTTSTSSGVLFSPTPDPFTGNCSSIAGSAVIQTAITVPNSLAANSAIGPTGFFVEDRYQSDKVGFIGSVELASPVNLSALSGATFLGISGSGGISSANSPTLSNPQLITVSAAPDNYGQSIELTGAEYPSNDPTQTPVPSFVIDLGAQDPNNNGYFPSATYKGTCSSCDGALAPSYAVVSDAGGKYTIFVQSGSGSLLATGWILFQQ